MNPRELWRLTRHALNAWVEDYAPSMGAALSYYTLFSITPLLVLGIAFVLMVSLVASAILSALGKWWGSWFQRWELLAHALDLVLSFGLMTVLFAMIYKIVPRVRIRWRDVWVGAAVTALLFA